MLQTFEAWLSRGSDDTEVQSLQLFLLLKISEIGFL